MLNEDDHIPLLNKAMRGLYPPGSTLKPMVALALQAHGVDPASGQLPRRLPAGQSFLPVPRAARSMNMTQPSTRAATPISTQWATASAIDAIAPVAKLLGLGQKFDLPVVSQRYGTMPDSAWKRAVRAEPRSSSAPTGRNRTRSTRRSARAIVIVNPLQLAVMAARIACGRMLPPRLLIRDASVAPPSAPFRGNISRSSAGDVGSGQRRRYRRRAAGWRSPGVEMGGKTGTAQVRRLTASASRGQGGDWKYRDHGLFVCFAPIDKPRYAGSVVIEHGMGGARAAAPVAKDVLTFLFDRAKAVKRHWPSSRPAGAARSPSGWRGARPRAMSWPPRRRMDPRHERAIAIRPARRSRNCPWKLIFLVAGDRRLRHARPLFGRRRHRFSRGR